MGRGMVTDEAVEQVRTAANRYRQHPWLKNPILLVASNGNFELRARTAAAQSGVRLVERSEIVALDGIARELLDAA